jgi:hydrogenase-4 membrane subunit HyfE
VVLKRKVLWVVDGAVSITVLAAVLVWSVLTPNLHRVRGKLDLPSWNSALTVSREVQPSTSEPAKL